MPNSAKRRLRRPEYEFARPPRRPLGISRTRKPAKLSEFTSPAATNSASASSTSDGQHADILRNLVEERGAVLA